VRATNNLWPAACATSLRLAAFLPRSLDFLAMRLTLRTLLAYMDDILEPADHEELEKRIEGSDFAHDLIHRTRDTMRRLRLTAPAVKGEGMGLDPNTVAEYLDNTLPADQVADFERVCLESDVHLAEVASCHHVLTMVLGEPAEIDPEVRRRMYALPTQTPEVQKLRIEPAHVQAPADLVGTVTVSMAPAIGPAAPAPPVRRVEVPDYLRAAEPSLLTRLFPAIAALVVLGGVSLLAFRPGGWLREDQRLAENESILAPPPATDSVPTAQQEVTDPPAAIAPDEGPPEVEPPVAVEMTTEAPPEPIATDIAPESTDAPAADAESISADADLAVTPLAGAPLVPPQPGENAESPVASTPAPSVEDPVDSPLESPEPSAIEIAPDGTVSLPSSVPMSDEEVPPQTLDAAPPDAAPAADEAVESPVLPGPVEPAGPPTLGTFSSAREVLLRLAEDGAWMRVPARSPIVAGSNLLALPTYRPVVDLATGLNVELLDGALMNVDVADASGAGKLTLVYGRALLINTSMSELSVPIRVGEIEATMRLKPNATVAIEAKRVFQPGTDAAKVAAPVEATLFAPVGGVVWQSPDTTLEVSDPGMWQLAGDSVGPLQAYQPAEWIDGERLRLWETMSSPAIERLITVDEPVDVQLLGLYDTTKRKEEKALLTQCSMHVGQFVPVVRSLKDHDQFPEWEKQIASLRAAMARSPELAQQVLDALIEQEGEEKAADLYQMLCGYSPEQIGTTPDEVQTGALKQLIDWLESDQLNYRVLAFHNLKEITGKSLSYNPNNADSRVRSVRIWRQRLKDNELISPNPQS
jgi:hypothetical protein